MTFSQVFGDPEATAEQVAAAVWAASGRSLTAPAPANSSGDSDGGQLTLPAGFDWEIPIALGALGDWKELFWTLKEKPTTQADSAAEIQVRLTNPTADGDGLRVLGGTAAMETDRDRASIVVNDAATGEIRVLIKAPATVVVPPTAPRFYQWDVKKIMADGSQPTPRVNGLIRVSAGVTKTLAAS